MTDIKVNERIGDEIHQFWDFQMSGVGISVCLNSDRFIPPKL